MIIISPTWMPYAVFKVCVTILCIFSSFIYAYFAAFRYDVDNFCFPSKEFDSPDAYARPESCYLDPVLKAGWVETPNQIDASMFTKNEISSFNKLQIVMELIFLLDCIFKFFVEYTDEITNQKVKDITLISMRYINTDFIYDFCPLIPFNFFLNFPYSRLLYLIKCNRLIPTIRFLDTGMFMKKVKYFFDGRLKSICKDPEMANNINLDNNKIMTIILIGYVFKTLKLVIIIFQVSYFLGIFYYIYCDITNDFSYVVKLRTAQ